MKGIRKLLELSQQTSLALLTYKCFQFPGTRRVEILQSWNAPIWKRQTCQSYGLMCKQHESLPPLCASRGICQQLVSGAWGGVSLNNERAARECAAGGVCSGISYREEGGWASLPPQTLVQIAFQTSPCSVLALPHAIPTSLATQSLQKFHVRIFQGSKLRRVKDQDAQLWNSISV